MNRLRPPHPESFTSTRRHPALTARLGTWLGVCFGLAFLTGLISHWYYLRDVPVLPPTRPVWGYRVTQGTHVLAGTGAVPLLLVKLWSVYPRLFAPVPRQRVTDAAVHLAERGSIAVLVAASIFQLATGLANAAQWYPWAFSFRATHYAVAWVAIGALLVHVAVKWPQIRKAYRTRLPEPDAPTPGPSRRAVLRTALLASGVAVLASAGSTVPSLRRVSVLAVRSGTGPQGVPVNRSAVAAGVTELARDPAYRLSLVHGDRVVALSRADLEQMPQTQHDLPIACVEGWSASGRWSGVRFADLLDRVGAPASADVRVTSLQRRGAFRSTVLPASFARDPLTLLALGLAGVPLEVDHGYPCRLIAPNRPGVFQTKWVSRIEVLT